MNNSSKQQPRKVYFSLAQVAFKMKCEKSHFVEMIEIFNIKPRIKKGYYKLTPSIIEIFYRIQILRDWGHEDEEISENKLYTDIPFLEIYNRKKAEELKDNPVIMKKNDDEDN